VFPEPFPAFLDREGFPRPAKPRGRHSPDAYVDTVNCKAIRLNLVGHEVVTAHNGLQAIKVARACVPQSILLDLGLPGMSGYEVARQLRQEEGGEDAVIVALSGYGQEGARHRTKAMGVRPSPPQTRQL
jgi:CheY-like chemotaxis protein